MFSKIVSENLKGLEIHSGSPCSNNFISSVPVSYLTHKIKPNISLSIEET